MKQTKTDFKTVCERLLPLVFHVAGNFSCAKRCCMTELIDQCLNVVDIFLRDLFCIGHAVGDSDNILHAGAKFSGTKNMN